MAILSLLIKFGQRTPTTGPGGIGRLRGKRLKISLFRAINASALASLASTRLASVSLGPGSSQPSSLSLSARPRARRARRSARAKQSPPPILKPISFVHATCNFDPRYKLRLTAKKSIGLIANAIDLCTFASQLQVYMYRRWSVQRKKNTIKSVHRQQLDKISAFLNNVHTCQYSACWSILWCKP